MTTRIVNGIDAGYRYLMKKNGLANTEKGRHIAIAMNGQTVIGAWMNGQTKSTLHSEVAALRYLEKRHCIKGGSSYHINHYPSAFER